MSRLTTFERALVDAVLCEYIDIPDSTEIQYEPSEKFKDAIKKIIAGFDKHRIVTVTVIKRLILVAIIAALLTGCALAIPAVREYLIEFFVTKYEDEAGYGISFDEKQAANAPVAIEIFYAPSYIPEGYRIYSEDYSAAGTSVFYNCGDERITLFCQFVIPKGATNDNWTGFNADNTIRSSKKIGDYMIESIYGEVNYVYIWTDNKYIYWLDCDIELPESEAEKMMLSLDIVPEEKLNQP